MDKPIISVNNISKQYVINHNRQSYYTLRDSIVKAIKAPFQLIGGGREKVQKEKFLALSDINFAVQEGETIGIIGNNGAGKSTLLKILSRITPPTTGSIHLRGRVASLLEVGTGFHPELTGRENIFLNGAILGMKQSEIKSKFEEIVTFAEIEKFLDTPVKRYSSGMYVRLAFAVAAHLEPEILIVDEVLAVGDVQFQKKCLGKMNAISQEGGRTVLFVSHNMEAIKKICSKCVLLKDGKIAMFDETSKVIKSYLQLDNKQEITPLINRRDREGTGEVKFTDIQITNLQGETAIKSHDGLRITLKYTSVFQEPIKNVRMVTIVSNDDLRPVLWLDSVVSTNGFANDTLAPNGTLICETKPTNLVAGNYFVEINFHIDGTSRDLITMATRFNVTTDLTRYNFRQKVDNTVCNTIVEYSYKQPH